MSLNHRNGAVYTILITIGIFFIACAGSSYINIRYQLPTPSDQFKDRTLLIDFVDKRTKKNFLSPTAQDEFRKFSGLFSLYLVRENQTDELVGGFNEETLFIEALKSRLENMGIRVVSERKKDLPIIEIVLKEFFLDYKSRKWIPHISFQTRLLKNERHIATETISISGERIIILGRGDVETYLGEIFTDSLNQLDLSKSFKQLDL